MEPSVTINSVDMSSQISSIRVDDKTKGGIKDFTVTVKFVSYPFELHNYVGSTVSLEVGPGSANPGYSGNAVLKKLYGLVAVFQSTA